MDVCPQCGRGTRPGDRFCLSCGQRLGEVPDAAWSQLSAGLSATSAPATERITRVAEAAPTFGRMRQSMSTVPRFTWTSADGATHEYELNTAEISIGRAPTCDIVLP